MVQHNMSCLTDDFQLLKYNWALDLSDIPEAKSYGIAQAIFFGFSAGLLGISGFETSANFVEEQKPGVFPKTLRNMWIIVSIYNPIIRYAASRVRRMFSDTGRGAALACEASRGHSCLQYDSLSPMNGLTHPLQLNGHIRASVAQSHGPTAAGRAAEQRRFAD